MMTPMNAHKQLIKHNNPVTIQEALDRMIPDADECYAIDPETGKITGKTLILCSDTENGFFFTDLDTGKKHYTLEDLRNAGIHTIAMRLEYILETNAENEETFRE